MSNIESGMIRTCLLYEFKLGTKASEACRKICLAFGKGTISPRTAQQWFKKFQESGESLEDAPRSGRPKKALNIDNLKNAVKNNSRITLQELSQMFNVSGETIRGRLHQLGITWRQGKWIQLKKRNKSNSENNNTCNSKSTRHRNGQTNDQETSEQILHQDEKPEICIPISSPIVTTSTSPRSSCLTVRSDVNVLMTNQHISHSVIQR